MKPKEIKVVKPDPYYKIIFNCSNRAFYGVKNELYELWDKSGVEDDFNNGYFTETCDYEGDLEVIIIYNTENIKPFTQAVLDYYGGNLEELGNMNLHLSIF